MADDALNRAILLAIRELARFLPNPIRGGYPDACDMETLGDDLLTIADIIDPLILAYGEHAAEHHHIPAETIKEHFEGVLRGALEGYATHVLQNAADDLRERKPALRLVPYR